MGRKIGDRRGGHNKKSLQQHLIDGTYRKDRHGPVPKGKRAVGDCGAISGAVAEVLAAAGGDKADARLELKFCGPPHHLRTAAALAELSAAFDIDLSRWERKP